MARVYRGSAPSALCQALLLIGHLPDSKRIRNGADIGVGHTVLTPILVGQDKEEDVMNDQTAKLLDPVSAAQAGSRATLPELYATYSRRLHKTIVAITKNLEDAEDALQETFLRAHVALHTFEGRSNIYSWLTRIAINSALMILRRRRNHPETLFDFQSGVGDETNYFAVEDSAPNPEELCDQRQRRLNVLRAIRSLRPGLRKPIQMQLTQGSSIREISRALDIPETAVKARLYRARRRLSAMHGLKHFVSDHHE